MRRELLAAAAAVVLLGCGGGESKPTGRTPYPLDPTPESLAPASLARLRASMAGLVAAEPIASAAGSDLVALYAAQLEALSVPLEARLEAARGAARAAVPGASAASTCQTHSGAAELEGVQVELTGQICSGVVGDRVQVSMAISTAVVGVSGGREGQALTVSGRINADAEACPTAEGKLQGTFTMNMEARWADGARTTAAGRTGVLEMQAYVGDDAEFDHADFQYEGSLRFEKDGGHQVLQLTSEAQGVKPEEIGPLCELLLANLEVEGDPGSLTVLFGISDALVRQSIIDVLAFPAAGAVVGSEAAKEHWHEDNACVELVPTPDPFQVSAGEARQLEVAIRRVSGGADVEGDVEAEALTGSVSPGTAPAAPGAPAAFTYTAPSDGAEGQLQLRATTRAGLASRLVRTTSPLRLALDATLSLTAGETTLTGHVRAEVALAGGAGAGSGPIEYLSFSWTLPGCSVARGALSASALVVEAATIDDDAPAATVVRLRPFSTAEAYVITCPTGGGPGTMTWFGGTFTTAHEAEAAVVDGAFALSITGWEKGTAAGVRQRKVYDRTVPMGGGTLTEQTTLELRGGAAP